MITLFVAVEGEGEVLTPNLNLNLPFNLHRKYCKSRPYA